MEEGRYTSGIRKILEKSPELKHPLEKVLRAFSCRKEEWPGQITICGSGDFDLFTLNSLFPRSVLKHRGDKIVFFSERMPAEIRIEDWLASVSEVVCPEKEKQGSGEDLLIGRLDMFFSKSGASIAALREDLSAVRRKISELGSEKAFAYYHTVLDAVDFLRGNDQTISPAELGARICDDSKAFRRGSSMWSIASKLLAEELCSSPESAMTECGVTENPTSLTVTVFGPFICHWGDESSDWISRLWEHGEAATLNAGNLGHLDRISMKMAMPLLSCENESPFNRMMREHDQHALVYSAGFPNSAVKRFISLVAGNVGYFHWGDTDPEGLAIAAILNGIKPLELCRCNAEECTRHRHALRHLDEKKRKRGLKMLESSDFPFRKELEFTLEHGWLEQESWLPVETVKI